MDPETGSGAPATSGQQTMSSQSQTAPAHNQATQSHTTFGAAPKVTDTTFSQFKEHSTFNVPVALTWIVAVFSVVATLFFWWMNRNLSASLVEKNSEKDTVFQQISSQGDIEKKATNFKSAVSQLKAAYSEKFSISTFNSDFNKKITNDVKLTNLAVTAEGNLSINGTTKSYRFVADLMVALKDWDTLTDVELLSAATDVSDGAATTSFSISAKIDKTKQKTAQNIVSSDDLTNETSMEGGDDAKI
ncbi:MAG: PilN domain-containing protein [Patescibacteria group bacterium]